MKVSFDINRLIHVKINVIKINEILNARWID